MKITEQFDDLETDHAPLQARKLRARAYYRAAQDSAVSATRKRVAFDRTQRKEPSLPRFKCLEDA